MPSGKLKVGSTAHVEVTKKTTTNNIFKKSIKYLEQNNNPRIGGNT